MLKVKVMCVWIGNNKKKWNRYVLLPVPTCFTLLTAWRPTAMQTACVKMLESDMSKNNILKTDELKNQQRCSYNYLLAIRVGYMVI